MPIDAKTRSAIIGGMRRIWHRHPDRILALKTAEVRIFPTNNDGTPAKRAHVFRKCALCGCLAKDAESGDYTKAAVDHIDPVVPLDGTVPTLSEIADRMFTTQDNLQVLCGICHTAKTVAENQLRREAKKQHAQPTRSTGRQRKTPTKRAG